MAGTVMMAVEGVLQEPEEFSVAALPSPIGRGLYEALSGVHRVVLVTSTDDYQAATHWLKSNYLFGYDNLLTRPTHHTETIDVRAAQLRALRASRTALAMVVDADPLVVVHAMSVGVPGLLYGPPRPAAGRLDLGRRKVRDWSAIEAEVDLQRGLVPAEADDLKESVE